MDTEPPRLLMGVAGLAGAAFWGMYALLVTFAAGQSPTRQDVVRAALNVMAGVMGGALAAYFLGPALSEFAPIPALQDPYVVGFMIGLGAWEVTPFAFRAIRWWAERRSKEAR